jgi:hypothetical protein
MLKRLLDRIAERIAEREDERIHRRHIEAMSARRAKDADRRALKELRGY